MLRKSPSGLSKNNRSSNWGVEILNRGAAVPYVLVPTDNPTLIAGFYTLSDEATFYANYGFIRFVDSSLRLFMTMKAIATSWP